MTAGVTGAQAGVPAPSAAVAAAASTAAQPYEGRRQNPRLVTAWASAWNSASPEQMAALFTADGVYQDFAFGASFRGRAEVASWVTSTTTSIQNVRIEVTDAFRAGNRISVRSVFSGQIVGAPTPFAVPVSTVMELRGGKISYNGDYYNLADVLRQSGLPAPGAPASS